MARQRVRRGPGAAGAERSVSRRAPRPDAGPRAGLMAEQRIEIRVSATGAEQAAKVLAAIAKEGGQIGSIVSPAIKKTEDALNSFGGTARRVFEVFAGVNLASVFEQASCSLNLFVTESAKLGLEAKVQEDAFAKLTQQVGVSADALVRKLQEVSGGILNT